MSHTVDDKVGKHSTEFEINKRKSTRHGKQVTKYIHCQFVGWEHNSGPLLTHLTRNPGIASSIPTPHLTPQSVFRMRH